MAYEIFVIWRPKTTVIHPLCKRIQALRRDYGLFVSPDVHTVQLFVGDVLEASGSSRGGAESLIKHKKCEGNKAKLET